jgi:hypothetical protein
VTYGLGGTHEGPTRLAAASIADLRGSRRRLDADKGGVWCFVISVSRLLKVRDAPLLAFAARTPEPRHYRIF